MQILTGKDLDCHLHPDGKDTGGLHFVINREQIKEDCYSLQAADPPAIFWDTKM